MSEVSAVITGIESAVAPQAPGFVRQMFTPSKAGVKEVLLRNGRIDAVIAGAIIALFGTAFVWGGRAVYRRIFVARKVAAFLAAGDRAAAGTTLVEEGICKTLEGAELLLEQEMEKVTKAATKAATKATAKAEAKAAKNHVSVEACPS